VLDIDRLQCLVATFMRMRTFAFTAHRNATAVIVDPATGTRIAGADPRRDCYAMAY